MTGANSFSVSGYGPQRAGWTRLFARDSLTRRLDWPMLLSALALSGLGSLLVYSATRNRTEINQGDQYYFLIRHIMNTGIGLALMIGTVWLGHRTLRNVVPILYGISLFGHELTLPVGGWNGGALRNMILPVTVLALPQIAIVARLGYRVAIYLRRAGSDRVPTF